MPPVRRGRRVRRAGDDQAIADELQLTVEAVKTHLRTLCRKFAVGDAPQNRKRLQLVETAMRAGLVPEREPRR